MTRPCLYALILLVALAGCRADPPPKPFAMPVKPLLGTFTVFERLDTGYIESRRYGGMITIEKIEGDDAGYRVSSETDVVFRFDPKTGRLTPELIDNDPSTPPFSSIVEIKAGNAGASRPPAPYYAPVPIHPQGVVLLTQSSQQLYLVRGAGPAYWADVPTNLPQGVERIEGWDGNRWLYARKVSNPGSRSERVIGELTLDGKPIDFAPNGAILFTPLGKLMYFGKPDRQAWQSGWLMVSNGSHPLFDHDGSLTDAAERYRQKQARFRERTGG